MKWRRTYLKLVVLDPQRQFPLMDGCSQPEAVAAILLFPSLTHPLEEQKEVRSQGDSWSQVVIWAESEY